MLISGKRKFIQDNNNYIDKYGKITHVCPKCGSVYINDMKLSVDCSMLCASQCARSNYIVETPIIHKICNCGTEAIQVDNQMVMIFKTFIDKGYEVDECCEGHCFVDDENYVPKYDLPRLGINGYIKALIPSAHYNSFCIVQEFNKTIITPKTIDLDTCPCRSLESFNEYKNHILETMQNMVNSLPDCPFSNNRYEAINSTCNCKSCFCG